MIEIQVLRFDKDKDSEPYFEKYKLDKINKMKVLDALIHINEENNANLSFRSSCRAGQCGSCGIKINGEPALACKEEVKDGDLIEPLDFPVIKDLIVDKSEIEGKVATMKLFLEKNNDKTQNNAINNSYCENKPDNDSYGESEEISCPSTIASEECINTKKVRSCIECYSCLSACPVIKETSQFAGPYFMRYISKFDFDPRDTEERTKESIANGLYYCTSCGKCREVCPKEINSFGDAIEKLRALAFKKDLGPLKPHKDLKEMIKTTGRSVEPLNESFIETINNNANEAISKDKTKKPTNNEAISKNKSKKPINDKAISKDRGKKPTNNEAISKDKTKKSNNDSNSKFGKIAIFTGCMVDYRLQNVGFALMDVLKENGFDADVPQDQVCCGSPLLRTGQVDVVESLVDKNKEVLSKYDTIITVCAGCGATLKNDYPKYGVDLNIMDISEFLVDNLNTEKMKDLNLKVSYHDPCHLNRGQGIRDEPRNILKRIKGVKFIEMEKPDQCCGAGGGVRAAKPEIASGLGKKKAEMVKKLDVDSVITICPFCQYNIQDALNKEGMSNVKVINILELLKKSYEA